MASIVRPNVGNPRGQDNGFGIWYPWVSHLFFLVALTGLRVLGAKPIMLSQKTSSEKPAQPAAAQVITDKAVRTMADSIFKHLQEEGCQAKDIINVSSQLLGLVTTQISKPQ